MLPTPRRLSGFEPDALVASLGPSVAIYVVGGAVRDELLDLQASDRDWVVTGATPEHMVAAGFTPVGADFPVFLHPVTHEEYALARTERKTAAGYRGFAFHAAPDVTLEADLQRRDLTINAMAMSADGTLHDPWGGLADLQSRTLRHVSPAFAEDPVRILRLARFAARFPGFSVHPQTLQFCADMVARGEAKALVAERVWQEMSRLLLAAAPAAGWQVLQACGAMGDLMDSDCAALLTLPGTGPVLSVLPTAGIESRWAFLLLAGGFTVDQATRLAARWRVPADCAELARLCIAQCPAWREAGDAPAVAAVLTAADVMRRPERFVRALEVMAAVARNPDAGGAARLSREVWAHLADAFRSLPVGDIAKAAAKAGVPVPEAVARARLDAVGQALAGLVKS